MESLEVEIARVVAAYIAMDRRHKNENLAHMESDAKKYPEKVVARLRLVSRNPGK